MSSFLGSLAAGAASGGRYYGVYRGLIVDSMDPTSRGRVRVKLPTLMQDGGSWAEVCRPFGAPAGTAARIGAEVWVMFEAGDSTRPVVIGMAG